MGVAEKIFHLGGSEIGRRAAAPVKLSDFTFFGDTRADVVDFVFERFQVGNRYAFVFLDGNITGAEQAEAFAEGKMHVERHRRGSSVGLEIIFFQIIRAEIVLPDRRGGITGVTRPGAIVFFEDRVGDLTDFERIRRIGDGVRHSFLTLARANRRSNRRGLTCGDEGLGVGDGGVGEYPVA